MENEDFGLVKDQRWLEEAANREVEDENARLLAELGFKISDSDEANKLVKAVFDPSSEEKTKDLLPTIDDQKEQMSNVPKMINEEEKRKRLILLDALLDPNDSGRTIAELFDLPPANFAEAPINNGVLSFRTNKRLDFLKITTVEELLRKTPDDLMAVPGFGKTSLAEIDQYVVSIKKDPLPALKDYKDIANFPNEVHDFLNNPTNTKCRSFFLNHLQDVEKGDYTALRAACEGDSEILSCIVKLETYSERVDLPLWEFWLSDPEKFVYLSGLLNEYAARMDVINEIEEALNRLPEYKCQNHACYYLAFYRSFDEDLQQLKNIFARDDMVLSDVIKSPLLCKENKEAVLRFLNWCGFDVYKELAQFMERLYKSDRDRLIILRRNDGYTLQEVGDEIGGISRERIRQIEAKMIRLFGIFQSRHKLLYKIAADRDGDMILTVDELSGFCKEYNNEVVYLLKMNKNPSYKYSKTMNVFLLESDGTEESKVRSFIEDMPDVFEVKDLPVIFQDAEDENVPVDVLKQFINTDFDLREDRYVRIKLKRNDIYRMVLEEYYKNGIRIYDADQLQDFKNIVKEKYGVPLDISDRALGARLGDIGIICGRGTYKAKSNRYLSEELAKDIENYIQTSPAPILPISYVYRVFETRLKAENVDNYHFLLGILHELFDEKFKIRKHYVSSRKEGFNVYELLQKMVYESDRPVSASQMRQVIPGLSPIVINISMDTPEILNYWAQYFHEKNVKISEADKSALRNDIKYLLADRKVHDSHEAFDLMQRKYAGVLKDNFAKDSVSCFSLLQLWFRNQFQFARPYIAEKGVTIVRAPQLLKNYIYSRDEILIDDMASYAKEIGLDKWSQLSIAKACDDKFFFVSNMKLVAIEKLGIDEEIAKEVESVVFPHVSGTMPIRELSCFPELPKVNVPWSDWLVYSTLKKWSTKLMVGESYNQIRLAVPLVARAGEYDTSVVFYDSKQQTSFSADDLNNLDDLLEDMIDWEDLEE